MERDALEQIYREKLTTPAEAVKLVRSGDTVYIGVCSSVAQTLSRALWGRRDELEEVTISCANMLVPLEVLSGERFDVSTYFMGRQERAAYPAGKVDFTSFHLSQIDIWCEKVAPPDVAFLEVGPPDEAGFCSYGASGPAMHDLVKEQARTVILQVNRSVPYVYGEGAHIHISEADAIVEADDPLPTAAALPVDSTIQTISDLVLEQIPDGACIQLGLGGVANAVGLGLRKKNDLGCHTELMTDSIMELMKCGALNNRRKTYLPGRSVTGFALGTAELYRYLDHNEQVCFQPFTQVNNPINIAKNDDMISINTALSIDLLGQVVADHLNGRQFSATGGQLDFVRGAQLSKRGKSFIAVTSRAGNGGKTASRIVARHPAGAVITTPRSDVQYVATEFGCVNLKELNMRDRVRAMIGLAHPDFRPQLLDEAKTFGLL